ncbi:S1C family serine protease [Oceanobacillus bengalensis]|uniref:Serine protease n=1 Tax=Oceanobacillus bengalensis TaxID=1435466 RepID=A0A494Z1G9_9BACI|nr:trypsin-like peptidase domain-containing protein [Oceanobacillus bengalensis]RKQ16376.1 serine protease [Oceanobacillus bengalensis]
MQIRKYLPITITIFILIIGIGAMVTMYYNWKSQEITVNKPMINKVVSSNDPLSLKSIIHEAEKNVILIEGQNELNTITGSGFLFNEKGDIITNAHVIKDAEVIYVRTANARTYPAAVVGISEDIDIAVIRVPQLANENTLSVETATSAEIGDEVIALGSPHGFQNTVTLGIISGTSRNFTVDGYDYSNVYQISAQITHGNSGGPLINRETGEIIGINSVGTADGTIGFSIPIIEVIDQINLWSNEAQNDQLDFASTSDIINTQKPELYIEDAAYLVNYFLESIEIRDYVNAYSLLGSTLQLETPYAIFRDQYIDNINLRYSEMNSNVMENNQIETLIDVTFDTRSESEQEVTTETVSLTFTIGYENDQLKILRIMSEEI